MPTVVTATTAVNDVESTEPMEDSTLYVTSFSELDDKPTETTADNTVTFTLDLDQELFVSRIHLILSYINKLQILFCIQILKIDSLSSSVISCNGVYL